MHGAFARRTDDKIHALVDANGLPIRIKLTEGQAHDGKSAADMLHDLSDGQILLADRAYDSDGLRQKLEERRAWANIKPMPTVSTCPPSTLTSTDTATMSNASSTGSSTTAIATRYNKHDANYLALIKLAASRIWIRHYESVT